MQSFFMFLSSLLFGYACSRLAPRKGRHPGHWFLIGTLFGLLGLILLAVLPPPKRRLPGLNLGGARSKAPPLPRLVVVDTTHSDYLWYYLDAAQAQFGPMSLTRLTQEWREGKLGDTTWVWNEMLDVWKPLKEVLKAE